MKLRSLVISLVVGLTTVGCGASTEPPRTDDVSEDASAANVSALDSLPEKNVDGLDVCAALSGEAVARAVGSTLVDTRVHAVGVNCVYDLGSPRQAVVVSVKDRMTYDAVRKLAESFEKPVEDLSGIGVAAYTKESADHDRQVWTIRDDGLVLSVQARDQQWAEAVAKLALDSMP
ncbi:MAG: hypothetical protein R3F58_11885 [Steroidobacteraceae bacterium]